jgi:hypothetical protein
MRRLLTVVERAGADCSAYSPDLRCMWPACARMESQSRDRPRPPSTYLFGRPATATASGSGPAITHPRRTEAASRCIGAVRCVWTRAWVDV